MKHLISLLIGIGIGTAGLHLYTKKSQMCVSKATAKHWLSELKKHNRGH